MANNPECESCGCRHAVGKACPKTRDIEWEQKRKRPALTKKDSKAKTLTKKPRNNGCRLKKQAPGRKTKHLAGGMGAKRVRQIKKIAEIRNEYIAVMRDDRENPIMASVSVKGPCWLDCFMWWCKAMILEYDLQPNEYADLIESECAILREELAK